MKSQEKIMQKEAKELAKWRKEQSKPAYKGYVAVLLLMIIVVHLIDSFSTDIAGSIQTSIVNEFFVSGMGLNYEEGLSTMSLISLSFIILAILSPFYKALADSLGRKKLFIISIFGMGLGMFICYLSTNLVVHLIGRALVSFFIAADIQVVYVLEVAPPAKRGTWYSMTKFIGVFGLILIPLSRSLFMDSAGLGWRNVFIIPAIIGLLLTLVILFGIKESNVFIENRIKYLETPYDIRKKQAEEKKLKSAEQKGGILRALKAVSQDRQMRSILLASACFYAATMAFYGYYESIMSTSGMSTETITQALFAYPFVYAALTLLSGIISDKIGRKRLALLYSILALGGLIGFIFTAKALMNPIIVGAFFGLAIGAYWNAGDFITITLAESAKTELRSSTLALNGLITVIVAFVTSIILSIIMLHMNLGTLCVIWGGAAVAIAILILMFRVKETMGVDLKEAGQK